MIKFVYKLIIGLLMFFSCWLIIPTIYNIFNISIDDMAFIFTIGGFVIGVWSALSYWFPIKSG